MGSEKEVVIMTDYRNCRSCPTAGYRIPRDMPDTPVSRKPACEYAVDTISGIEGLPLGIAYVPVQKYENLYDIDAAFKAGTLFKELDKPFTGRCCGI